MSTKRRTAEMEPVAPTKPLAARKSAQAKAQPALVDVDAPRINGNRRVMEGEILDAATEVFAEKGYLGTNLNDVAERLGVTRQALYYHFRAKHDILLAIFDCIFRDLDKAIDEAVAGVDDPAERFRKMVRAHFIVVVSTPHRTAISLQEHRNLPPAFAKTVLERREKLLSRFAKSYSEAVACGEFKDLDPMIVSQLIIGAGTSMYRWFRPKGKLNNEQIAAFADDILFAGYLRPDAASPGRGPNASASPARR